MIACEAPVRWAANAPSAALLAAALRQELPYSRLDLGSAWHLDIDRPTPLSLRLRVPDTPGQVLRRHLSAESYRLELCNLRFYNAVARPNVPRPLQRTTRR